MGNASTDSMCAPCAPGTYSTMDDTSACGPHSVSTCGPGKVLQSGTTEIDSFCQGCAPGTFSVGGTVTVCTDCGSNAKYIESVNASACKTCPSGSSTSGGTATTRTACTINNTTTTTPAPPPNIGVAKVAVVPPSRPVGGGGGGNDGKSCGDGLYFHQQLCIASCPGGFYGETSPAAVNLPGTPQQAPTPLYKTCRPCKAGCPKCHDAENCNNLGCSTTCIFGAGKSVETSGAQECSTCAIAPDSIVPDLFGPGGAGTIAPTLPPTVTIVVVSNPTLPPTLAPNATLGNTTYTHTDACGKNTTKTTKTISEPGKSGQQFWCSWWSPKRDDWVTDGCSAVGIVGATNTSNATVICKCTVVLPADDAEASFSGDFNLVTNYAFARVSSTFMQDTPFEASPQVLLLCCLPSALYLVLLAAFRFMPHRVFSYQRGSHLSPEERDDWCVVCICVYMHVYACICVCV